MSFTISMTEAELIDSCIANERKAQKDLYDRYKRAMYTTAYRITGSFEEAEEVLQDAFLSVYRNLAKFRRESTLGAWIKTIVVRTALKKVKKKIRFEPIEDYHHREDFINWDNTNLDVEYLEKAISQLPEGYRTVFVMVEIEGFPHKEIAKMLDISEGTSKSQLFHAKKKLRTILGSNDFR
ncbi:MAG: RNA polymerase sigma factor (sigma-70 family) [Saprospiraceae bacterium]|jgi:RNA polymerase sigma factor (sigma-70 family)